MHVLRYQSFKGLFTWTRDSELPRGKCYLEFTWWFVVPGQRCPGSTSLPRGKFVVVWSLRIYLNSFSFYRNCYRELILNTFTYFRCFLELFIGKFILNINNELAQEYYCPGATFAFCSHGEVTSARRVTRCCTTGNPPLEVAPGQGETHVNSCRRQTVHRSKVDPGVSGLPRGNELSRDHVNRP